MAATLQRALPIALLVAIGVGVPLRAQDAAPAHKLTFQGDTAIWTVAIRPEKTADFEQVMARLHEALLKSAQPTRHQQAEGWRVVRLAAPLPDGNVAYVHVVRPVIPEADYTVMQILYDELPDERQALYELYRGAFAKNLSLATGVTIADMSAALSKGPSEVAAR
ncbi:MAG TPA: hypothetical protein VIY56_06765 [Vicinamibacterales bacterium]